MILINWIILGLSSAFFLLMMVSSIMEKESRAVVVSSLGLILNGALWSGFNYYFGIAWLYWVNTGVLILLALMALVSLFKWFPPLESRDMSEAQRFDERDYMFSRNNLKNHPELAKLYYEAHPDKREIDEKIHGKPNIGEPGALYYDEYYSPAFDAPFIYLSRTRSATTGEPAKEKKEIDKTKFSRVIAELARYYGAVDVGYTRLKPYHLYTHKGRHAEDWGKEIKTDHQSAVVIVVAMDVEMMKGAPALPAILESSRHYVESAKIAAIVAEYIRFFGYDARAHTDGNYQVMCVPMAVDAGLGELGRLGIFMHPVYGPCVRISAVTTELQLVETEPLAHKESNSIYRFCEICKKCAENCPTRSISMEGEPESRGFRHWSIDQEGCFAYWKNIGTDCGFCIRVCPYTKPDTLIHKLVRWYISRNPINQRIALLMDDLFYGRNRRISNKNPHKIL